MRTLSLLALPLLLAACIDAAPDGGSQRSTAKLDTLKIATWNLEHLAERNGEGCRPREDADYAALRRAAGELGADVIAFQEVENKAAAERVFSPDEWTVVISGRSDAPRGGCRGLPGQTLRNQDVGFAIRKGVPFTRNPDVRALGLDNPGLRWGVDVTIDTPKPLRLLSVHLKSGCNSGRAPSDRDCDVLFEQVPVLERWIDARAEDDAAFAVLGDWNRRLSSRGDAVWTELDDGEPANADLTLAAGRQGATCKAKYREFIDHIALDRRATAAIVPGSFAEFTYGLPEEQHPSDHCPVSVSLQAR